MPLLPDGPLDSGSLGSGASVSGTLADLSGFAAWANQGSFTLNTPAPSVLDQSATSPGYSTSLGSSTLNLDPSAVAPAGSSLLDPLRGIIGALDKYDPTSPTFLQSPSTTTQPMSSDSSLSGLENSVPRIVTIVMGVGLTIVGLVMLGGGTRIILDQGKSLIGKS